MYISIFFLFNHCVKCCILKLYSEIMFCCISIFYVEKVLNMGKCDIVGYLEKYREWVGISGALPWTGHASFYSISKSQVICRFKKLVFQPFVLLWRGNEARITCHRSRCSVRQIFQSCHCPKKNVNTSIHLEKYLPSTGKGFLNSETQIIEEEMSWRTNESERIHRT